MDNDREMAEMTIKFLGRVDLKGEEVPAYVAIRNWLEAKRTGEQTQPAFIPKDVKVEAAE